MKIKGKVSYSKPMPFEPQPWKTHGPAQPFKRAGRTAAQLIRFYSLREMEEDKKISYEQALKSVCASHPELYQAWLKGK